MTTILEENETDYLVQTSDGKITTKSKSSDLNKLLYQHNLYGLLEEGDEIWQEEIGKQTVKVVPGDDAKKYDLTINQRPSLTLNAARKTDLVDAFAKFYSSEESTLQPFTHLYETVRGEMIRSEPLSHFAAPLSDRVVERDDGWFINGHLLLTFENDFYHSENVSRKRDGSVIGEGMSAKAYGVNFDKVAEEIDRELIIDDTYYYLTKKETRFLAKAIWAVENTPDRR